MKRCFAVWCSVWCSVALAQQPPGKPALPQAPQQAGSLEQLLQQLQRSGASGLNQKPRDRLDPRWSDVPQPPAFPGFPSLALPGFGTYPSQANADAPPTGGASIPAPTGWPEWVLAATKQALPNTPDRALLVRHGDRVWFRERQDEAMVPLFYFEKLKGLAAGAQISVRQAGEFEVLLFDSGRLVASGPTELTLGEMSATRAVLEVQQLTALRFEATGREHELRLPGGVTLVVPSAASPDEIADKAIVALVQVRSPGEAASRYALFHGSGRKVVVRIGGQGTELHPGQRLELLFAAPRADRTASPGLAAQGGTWQMQGDVAVLTSATPNTAQWMGASFTLAAGSQLRLVPLQGKPFATK